MARVVLGSYMVRYPLGGMLSWVLQYLVGFDRLGHDVWFVEKSGYPNSCFDPTRSRMSDDCSYGCGVVHRLLEAHGMGERWCFVDATGEYHGVDRRSIEDVLSTANVFFDMGTHGAWLEEASDAGCTALIDGEPGFTQMKMALRAARGEPLPEYDHYFTTGRNIAAGTAAAPDAGRRWKPLPHPVVCDLFEPSEPPPDAPFTTVMNWQSYAPLEYDGHSYGHKDVEFERFAHLPRLTGLPLEVAVSGPAVPTESLREHGWRVRSGQEVTRSVQSFGDYVHASSGEFGVVKHGFAATRSGWFSDRSAVYLAQGRPVVLDDTGFGDHLPCGEGLFAAGDADQASAALEQIAAAPERHRRAAREIAVEHLDARKVLAGALAEVGVA